MLVGNDLPLSLVRDIESFQAELSRRRFFLVLAGAGLVVSTDLNSNQRKFLEKTVLHLLPEEALRETGIDVVSNLENLLRQASAEHRRKVQLLLAWSQRLDFIYGGPAIAVNARKSRFVLMRKLAKALSSLCLVGFWGDERAIRLISDPAQERNP